MDDLNEFKAYMLEEELSENTMESYLFAVSSFFERYETLTKENVLLWKKELVDTLSPGTVNLRLCGLERYCDFKNIDMKIKRVKYQKITSVENVITEKQYKTLIEGLEKDGKIRFLAMIEILSKTGARISEAVRFTKSDMLRGYMDLSTKGKVRRIYFPKNLVTEIAPVLNGLADGDKIFRNRKGKDITSRGFDSILKSCAKKYKIPKEVMHAHSFRHFFAIQFLKRNNNISLLADILGHSGVNTTMIYLRMSKEKQKKEIDKAVNW